MTEPREPAAPGDPNDAGDAPTGIPTRPRQPWWRQAISIGITVLVLVLVFGFVIPQFSDYRAIVDYLADIDPLAWIILAGVSLAFLLAYPVVLTTVIRTLRLREAFVNHMTGTAITNTLPSGGAIALGLNYAMYLSWGFTPPSVTAGLLAAGVWDWYVRIALPVLAVVAIAVFAEALPWMWFVTIGGTAWVAFSVWIVAMLLRSRTAAESIARWIDRVVARVVGWFHREPPDTFGGVMQFRSDLRSVIANRAWPLTAATVGNHVAMASLYTASVYAVGISPSEIPVPWVVLSFALGRFLVMIPISPGGLGLVDLGWIGLLTLGWQTTNPGIPVDTDAIAAGVLLFRALSLFPPIPIGMASWLYWRFDRSWRQPWQEVRRGATPGDSEGPVAGQLESDGRLDGHGQEQPQPPPGRHGDHGASGGEVHTLPNGDHGGDEGP
jgi:uncharacterized membrane protein YbhN (UPF0104 family)